MVISPFEIVVESGAAPLSWFDPEAGMEVQLTALLGALLARRSGVDRIGNFDTSYEIASDTDWILRARDAGLELETALSPCMRYRMHEDQSSRREDLLMAENRAVTGIRGPQAQVAPAKHRVTVPGLSPRRVRIAWRPGQQQELLLRAALSSSSQTAQVWHQARAFDLEALDSSTFELLPLLYRRLVAAGVEDPRLGRLKEVYRRVWYGNQLILRRTGRALEVLRAEGVDAMVLGGAAVGLLHYRDVGARSMSDTRIAVRPTAVAHARALLHAP